jgi:hypothetical protein
VPAFALGDCKQILIHWFRVIPTSGLIRKSSAMSSGEELNIGIFGCLNTGVPLVFNVHPTRVLVEFQEAKLPDEGLVNERVFHFLECAESKYCSVASGCTVAQPEFRVAHLEGDTSSVSISFVVPHFFFDVELLGFPVFPHERKLA